MRRGLAVQLRELAKISGLLVMRAQTKTGDAVQKMRDQEVVLKDAERDLETCYSGWQSAMADPRLKADIALGWGRAVAQQSVAVTLEQACHSETVDRCARETRDWYRARLLHDDSLKRARDTARHIARLRDEASLSEIADLHAGKVTRA